jgi:hypothetical protein
MRKNAPLIVTLSDYAVEQFCIAAHNNHFTPVDQLREILRWNIALNGYSPDVVEHPVYRTTPKTKEISNNRLGASLRNDAAYETIERIRSENQANVTYTLTLQRMLREWVVAYLKFKGHDIDYIDTIPDDQKEKTMARVSRELNLT